MRHPADATAPVRLTALIAALPALVAGGAALAADAERGAQVFLQLPDDTPSCVSCHGADPAASRNNLLRAADQPLVLQKTLGAVSAMGYLKPLLTDADVADLAAYLGTVARVRAATTLAVWPRTLEFGALAPGAASAVSQVVWQNLSPQTVPGPAPRLVGGRFALDGGCREPVPAGGSCAVGVRALAGAAGDLADTLVFGADPLQGVAMVGLSAQVNAAPAARWVADLDAVDFGSVVRGQSAERLVVLRNAGTAAGALGAATLTGPGVAVFEGQEGCSTGAPVLPGQSCLLRLRYSPTSVAAHRATLQLRADGTHPQTLLLRGQGVDAPADPPKEPPPAGHGGGGGGCAMAPAARPGDVSLWALVLAAAAALGWRRRRSP